MSSSLSDITPPLDYYTTKMCSVFQKCSIDSFSKPNTESAATDRKVDFVPEQETVLEPPK